MNSPFIALSLAHVVLAARFVDTNSFREIVPILLDGAALIFVLILLFHFVLSRRQAYSDRQGTNMLPPRQNLKMQLNSVAIAALIFIVCWVIFSTAASMIFQAPKTAPILFPKIVSSPTPTIIATPTLIPTSSPTPTIIVTPTLTPTLSPKLTPSPTPKKH